MSSYRSLVGGLLVVILLAPAAAEAARGRITRWTGDRVYLDKGQSDGLEAGQTLQVRAGRRRAGSCVVEELYDHHATCSGKVQERADRFAFTSKSAKKPAAPKPRDVVVSDAIKSKAATAFAAAHIEEITYSTSYDRYTRSLPVEVAMRIRSWTSADGARDFHQARVMASLRGVPTGVDGVSAWAHMHIDGVLGKGEGARFFANRPLRVEVYELALRYSRSDVDWTGAVGRLRPFNVVGLTVLDGAQGAWQAGDGAVELGAYAGSIPDFASIAPTFDRLAGGGYWSLHHVGEQTRIRHLGRVGVRTLLSGRAAIDLEGLVDFAYANVRGSAGVRGVVGEEAGLELGWAQLGYDAGPFDVSGGYRYFSAPVVELDLPTLAPTGAHHADLHARWQIDDDLRVGAHADAHLDTRTEQLTVGVGPELNFGALQLGYRESLGGAAGRSVYLGAGFTPTPKLYFRTRTTWLEDHYDLGVLAPPQREVAQLFSLDYALLRWLTFRGSARFQAALPDFSSQPTATPMGLSTDLTLLGSL